MYHNKLVIDIENKVTDGNPSPYHVDNYLVCVGHAPVTDKVENVTVTWFKHNEYKDASPNDFTELQNALDKADLLIGHNIKYDMSWLYECGFTYDGDLHDTMTGEYLLARGEKLALSLAESCIRRKVTLKKSELIEEYFSNKVGFEAMPIGLVGEYNKYDIISCGELYLEQDRLFNTDEYKSILPILTLTNEMTKVLIDIERNGLAIDVDALETVRLGYANERAFKSSKNKDIVKDVMGDKPFNLASPEQLSEIVWSRKVNDKNDWARVFGIGTRAGGTGKYKNRIPKKDLEDIVKAQTTISRKTEVRQCSTCRGSGIIFRRKKDGTPYKKHPKCQSCRGTGYTYKQLKEIAGFKFSPTSVDQVTANGFATDKTTFGSLAEIAEAKGLNEAHTFLTNMQRINALDTYINSFCKGIQQNVYENGILHPQINQVRTATGRLSSSKPNFQNLPRGGTARVRKAIVSRFEGGKVLEGDFAQLEFRTAVWVADDPVGKKEINEGFDVHAYTAKVLTEAGQETSRQEAKARTFRPLYGGMSGSPAEVAYNKSFMAKYSSIGKWHETLQEEAINNKTITTITGRQFSFPKVSRTRYGSTFATQIKNYPVQSIATAEIVPLACILFKEVLDSKKYKSLIINTVHDSIVVDVHPDEIDIIPFELKKAMLRVPERLLSQFNLTLDVPMGVDLKIGDDWLDMEEIDEPKRYVREMEERTVSVQQVSSL
jgi:DNA polymerase I-like protein with 3'-5' exonuclease and polymerase domains